MTSKPLNFYDWKECFTQYAIKTYGIVGQALRDMEYPALLEEQAFTLDDDEAAPQANTTEYQIYKTTLELRAKKWYNTKRDFTDNSPKLFSDMILHMCEESRIITQQRTSNYEDLEADADFVGLMTAIEDAHLNEGGPEATIVNQMEARRHLERLGQRSGQPLHEFEREFTRRLRMCRGVI